MKVLVTGAAGFIGYHLSKALCERGDQVVGVDNLNDYYDVSLKQARLARLQPLANFQFQRLDLAHRAETECLFKVHKFDRIVHLAAQAGVRYSMVNPHAYVESNLVGFLNVLEGARHQQVDHLVYASSSSVYGANESFPFRESDNVDHPVSLYAATKKANEAMAHSYSHLYGLPTTGLRFFTVYGPWGRPDMSPMLFAKAIMAGKPIQVFNYGKHKRDFTYIDDVVRGVILALDHVAQPDSSWSGLNPDPATSRAPWRVYNIGNSRPVELLHFIECLEAALGKKAEKIFLPLQRGDVESTYADVTRLMVCAGYEPETAVEVGVNHFVCWLRGGYNGNTK